MRLKLLKLLRRQDDLGHPISLTYKGDETYQTVFGGFLTLAVQLITMVLIITAAIEVLSMNEPQIS